MSPEARPWTEQDYKLSYDAEGRRSCRQLRTPSLRRRALRGPADAEHDRKPLHERGA